MAKKLILIHGLSGDPKGTWGEFPKFLREDSELDYDVLSFRYDTCSGLMEMDTSMRDIIICLA